MLPFSITRMTSAPRIVDNRCAITKLVRSLRSAFIASWINTSVRVSTELVGLVEDEDRRIGEERPGDREQLLLAGADVVGLFVDERVVPVGQGVHEAVDVGRAPPRGSAPRSRRGCRRRCCRGWSRRTATCPAAPCRSSTAARRAGSTRCRGRRA